MRPVALRSIILFCLLTTCGRSSIVYQNSDSLIAGSKVSVIPGPEYQAGWLHTVFFGEHWRSLWTTPIKVNVIDLSRFAGGLTVLKRGGGFQTKSLHFKGKNGKYYKFRSINKDPKKVLPIEFRETFVADIIQDQISTSHPLSALIAAPLLTQVGILNAEPQIVVLPDDPLLGEFRSDYKGVLGTFAENPKDDTDEELIFAGADKVVKEYKIFEKLDDDNDNQVDALEYLKARLMDIYLGDWDRHVGQWKWARFKDGDEKIWEPVPRDRDQAFSRYDGIFPWIAAKAIPQIEGFSDTYPQINDLTWSGRHMDRRFLASVNKDQWDSVTAQVYTTLTDQVIESAVKRMPEKWFAKAGPELIRMLKQRRDDFPEISQEYYDYMAQVVSIYGSDKSEFVRIDRTDDETVTVNMYKKNKDTGKAGNKLLYRRIFSTDYTDEIRIDLLGGDDTAEIYGNVDKSILIRVIGGDGKDIMIDSSRVNGYVLDIGLFRYCRNNTYFYDSGKKSIFVSGPSTVIDTEKVPEAKPYNEGDNINEKYEPPVEDRDYDWKAGYRFNFNSNDGVTIGGGPILIKHAFRKDPYQYRLSLLGAYVTNLRSFVVDFNGEFITAPQRMIYIKMRRAIGYTNFYGYGNSTLRDENLHDNHFYRVRYNLTDLLLNYIFDPVPQQKFQFGLSLNNGEITYDAGTLLDSLDLKNLNKRTNYGIHLGILIDYRDHQLMPLSGFYAAIQSNNYPRIINGDRNYHKLTADIRGYLQWNFISSSSLALRFQGEKLWGNYQLHESAFLGGQKNLRGFTRERFAGDALVYGGIELRSFLFPLKIIFPAQFGFSAFTETGRVFYSGDNSKKWHPSWGGGLWISFLNHLLTLNGTIAQSHEDSQFYLTTSLMF